MKTRNTIKHNQRENNVILIKKLVDGKFKYKEDENKE